MTDEAITMADKDGSDPEYIYGTDYYYDETEGGEGHWIAKATAKPFKQED